MDIYIRSETNRTTRARLSQWASRGPPAGYIGGVYHYQRAAGIQALPEPRKDRRDHAIRPGMLPRPRSPPLLAISARLLVLPRASSRGRCLLPGRRSLEVRVPCAKGQTRCENACASDASAGHLARQYPQTCGVAAPR
eukprot:scaffold71350_cov55-Phaeocystis_antarctica.AAC.1